MRRVRLEARRKDIMRVLPWAIAIASGAAAIVLLGAILGDMRSSRVPTAVVPQGPQLLVERTFGSSDTTPAQPNGVVLAGGKLYVADPVRRRVDVYTEGGSHVASIGAGELEVPVYAALGPIDGRLYVSDRDLSTIVVFAADGKKVGYLDPDGLHPKRKKRASWRPLGLAFAANGTLYVSDSSDDAHIAVFSPAGSRVGTWGADVPSGRSGRTLAFPNGMVVKGDELIVADSNNGRIVYFGLDGSYHRAVTVQGIPRGIALLPDGGLLISDAATGQLRTHNAGGAVRATYDPSRAKGPRRLSAPAGVAADRDGTMFVADPGTGAVAVVEERAASASAPPVQRTEAGWTVLAASLCALLAMLSAIFGYFGARKRPASRNEQV